MSDMPAPLDGNAIGGLLRDVFGAEVTAAVGRCATCGAAGPVAECLVYVQAPGTVVRCHVCRSVLMVVVTRDGLNCVDLDGMESLQL
jgi:hypothetical protein